MEIFIYQFIMCANVFLAGYFWSESKDLQDTTKGKIVCYLVLILYLFIGLPLVLSNYIWDVILVKILNFIDGFFQIRFLFMFHFTKEYNNLEEETLQFINEATFKRKKDTLRNRIYHKCTSMVNKRNNYTYTNNNE